MILPTGSSTGGRYAGEYCHCRSASPYDPAGATGSTVASCHPGVTGCARCSFSRLDMAVVPRPWRDPANGGMVPDRRSQHEVRHHHRVHRRMLDIDRKSTRLNSSHRTISYAVFCLKKKTNKKLTTPP